MIKDNQIPKAIESPQPLMPIEHIGKEHLSSEQLSITIESSKTHPEDSRNTTFVQASSMRFASTPIDTLKSPKNQHLFFILMKVKNEDIVKKIYRFNMLSGIIENENLFEENSKRVT